MAIDTEVYSASIRDRLCVVNFARRRHGRRDQIAAGQKENANLVQPSRQSKVTELPHFGRFDIAVLYNAFGVMASRCSAPRSPRG